MATLSAMFSLFDSYSVAIDKINNKMTTTTVKILLMSKATEQLNNSLKLTGICADSADKGIKKLINGFNRISQAKKKIDLGNIDDINSKTNKAADKVLKTNIAADKPGDKLKTAGVNMVGKGIGKLVGKVFNPSTMKKGMDMVDEYTNASIKLNSINDGKQELPELHNMVYKVANKSDGNYYNMMDNVSKMGTTAGGSFESNAKLIRFTELAQKSLKIGGASEGDQSSAMDQLTQAMSSGGLKDDGFSSMLENAPVIANAISKYTGKSIGELKKMSSEGKITSDVIRNSVFAMSGDIDSRFETMPMTFADVWNKVKDGALKAFEPIMEAVNNLINTQGFNQILNGVIMGFDLLGKAVMWLFNTIASNWDTIGPILTIIATVLIGYLWAMIPPLLVQAAAWLLSYWPILLIIGVILIAIYVACQLGASWEQIFSVIGGVIGVFATSFYNSFVFIWNAVAAFINFFGNVFKNPVASVQALFFDLMVNVLNFIGGIAKGIEELLNKIPGVKVNITGGITSLRDKLAAKSAGIKSEAGLVEFAKTKEFMDYSQGYAKGSDIGKDIYGNVIKGFSKATASLNGINNKNGLNNLRDSNNPLTVKGQGNNGAVDVNMADEDIQYLRDAAERDYIAKVSSNTLAPNVAISFGDVHETADADKIAGRIRRILQEEITMASEGVYN